MVKSLEDFGRWHACVAVPLASVPKMAHPFFNALYSFTPFPFCYLNPQPSQISCLYTCSILLPFSFVHFFKVQTSSLPMEKMRRPQIPSFGDWNQYNELPITQYFESAIQAGLVRTSQCSEEGGRDLLYFSSPVKPTYQYQYQYNEPKIRKGVEKQYVNSDKIQQRKQQVAVRPVDEDLYKIPPELLRQKPKRRFLRSLLTGCLGLNCVA
ncbi:hypothetical protein LUZ60_008017 [Juncus effusus]|nr:hypothetical protein LUZ60_008017 [Juncus effusus]